MSVKPVSLEERLLYDLAQGWVTAEEVKRVMAVTIGADGRPYTDGKLIGEDLHGNLLVVDKRFLIDTGVQISALDEDNARQFKMSRLTGAGARGAGGEGLDVYEYVTFQFSRTTADGSSEEEVTCHLPFAVVRRS